jgi:hypothetical protein
MFSSMPPPPARRKGTPKGRNHMTEKPKKPALTIDYTAYEHFLENSDASDEEKRELLETLWNVICEFVAIGFNVHPVQQAMQDKNSGQVEKNTRQPTPANHDTIESKNATPLEIFSHNARG